MQLYGDSLYVVWGGTSMSSVLSEHNVRGARTEFIEYQGELLHKQIGSTQEGTLILTKDNDILSLELTDAEKVGAFDIKGNQRGLFTWLFGGSTRPEPTIKISFTQTELSKGIVIAEYWAGTDLPVKRVLEFYDMKTHKGCWFMFENKKIGDQWARYFNIERLAWTDSKGNGNLIRKDPL